MHSIGHSSLLPSKIMDSHNQPDIKDFTLDEFREHLVTAGIAPFRANQIFKWVYLRQIDDFSEMTDLSKDLRQQLSDRYRISRLAVADVATAKDGTRKFLFRLKDGHLIETVLIPEKDHFTVCISSQVGCAQDCRFCMTATGGFHRNLTAGEIIAQVRDTRNVLLKEQGEDGPRLSNIVFMGMGEPLANYRNVARAISTITDGDCGLKFSGRRVTVSTSGLVPRLADLGRDGRVNLAISLNATENKTRDKLMPINRAYPIETLLAACKAYPLAPRQKITFEYILMKGVNDSLDDARRLVRLLSNVKAKINLIPFNEHTGCAFLRPERHQIQAFLKILLDKGFTAMIRWSKGEDIGAACGQLAGQEKERS